MKVMNKVYVSVLIAIFVCVAFHGMGGTAAFAATGDGPVPAHEPSSAYGPLFYIGLGAVAAIATFAIWQNVKDSEKDKIEAEVKEAEEREVEDFEEYFKELDDKE